MQRKRQTVFLFAIVMVSLVAVSGCDKLRARDKLNKGVQAYKGGQTDAAIEDFKQATQFDPELLNARLYLATAYSAQYIPGAPSTENIRNGDQAKAGKDIHVSLNSVAMEVLARQVGKHPVRVFTYAGKPLAWANTKGWREALKRAGIKNFRWHDLRHTFGSLLVAGGVDLVSIKDAMGHSQLTTTSRYLHARPATERAAAFTAAFGGSAATASYARRGESLEHPDGPD